MKITTSQLKELIKEVWDETSNSQDWSEWVDAWKPLFEKWVAEDGNGAISSIASYAKDMPKDLIIGALSLAFQAGYYAKGRN